jgi:hypothetical protein
MARSKRAKLSGTPYAQAAFSGVLGGFAAMALVGFTCFVLFAVGYYLIVTYNKPGTKLFKEIQPMQYLGMVLCFIALLPFLQYFFMGLLFNAGGAVFDSLME